MRRLINAIALLTATLGSAAAETHIDCDMGQRRVYVCYVTIEGTDSAALTASIWRKLDRTWEQPRLMLEVGGKAAEAYRLDAAADAEWGRGDELADQRLLTALQTGRTLRLLGADNTAGDIDVSAFASAYARMIALAQTHGFIAEPPIPLDEEERAAWFAKRLIEERLTVPGSGRFEYLEAFPRAGGVFIVCGRYSALNLMGVRGAASGFIMELEPERWIRDRKTHRVNSISEREGAHDRVFASRWQTDCSDLPNNR
jgi:hypothetical protein